jgi:purine-nucleoside phosphorylase
LAQEKGGGLGQYLIKSKRAEKRLITPGELLKSQDVDLNQLRLKKALLAFMSISGMKHKFRGKPAPGPIFSHNQDRPHVREDGTVLVGRVYGGPFCSIILEELAFFGVKYAVGYGFSGTLDSNVVPGSIMIAESGICSDGASKEYTCDQEVYADAGLFESLKKIIRKRDIEPQIGKVWTTDAMYREYPSKIKVWKKSGARFCNLETSPFYTVAREVGIKAVYFSIVSDNVEKTEWSGWAPDLGKITDVMWDVSLEMIESLQ